MDAQYLKSILGYDASTGLFRWLDGRGRKNKGWFPGSNHGNGYYAITIDGKWYYAHRLAWLHTHKGWPAIGIDHINGSRSDNRLMNLREADQSKNNMNSRSRRKSGLKGVYLHKASGLWHARIHKGGKAVSMGYHKTEAEAHAAYISAAYVEYGEFARAS